MSAPSLCSLPHVTAAPFLVETCSFFSKIICSVLGPFVKGHLAPNVGFDDVTYTVLSDYTGYILFEIKCKVGQRPPKQKD